MNPYIKLIWVLYSLFAIAVFVPLGWGIALKVSDVFADESSAALAGFGAAALFLASPFVVLAVRAMRRRRPNKTMKPTR